MLIATFDFHPRIAEGIRQQNYIEATPIQEQAIPPILDGNDVVCLAQTGTGKTAVFVLPILEHLIERRGHKVRALVLSPTRELSEQTQEFFWNLGSRTRLDFISIYGGVKIDKQIKRLNSGVDVVVACPGRLLDHLNRGTVDLSHIEILVIDEADRMFDMGFLPDVRKIVRHLPKERQTMLFSATMPKDVRKLTSEVLTDPVTIEIAPSMPAESVAHALYPVKQYLKTALLMELLKRTDTGSVLVFTKTKHKAKRVANQLYRAGFKAGSLRGDMTQNARKKAIDRFKNGSIQVLVATDVAARGIDVSTISHVINYDIPDTPDNYIHRIGRTGRADRKGDAFTFITDQDNRTVHAIERVLGEEIERCTLDGFDYDAPAPVGRPPREHDRRRPRDRRNHGGRQKQSQGSDTRKVQGNGNSRAHGRSGGNHRSKTGPNRNRGGNNHHHRKGGPNRNRGGNNHHHRKGGPNRNSGGNNHHHRKGGKPKGHRKR